MIESMTSHREAAPLMPGIVVEIGSMVEQHMKNIGLIHDPEMDEATRKLIAEKRAAYEQAGQKG